MILSYSLISSILIGTMVTAIYFLVGLVTLWRIIERGERKEYGTFLLILAEDKCRTAPFSWGRWIVMSRKDHEEFGDMILLHEHAHLRQQHWIDIVMPTPPSAYAQYLNLLMPSASMNLLKLRLTKTKVASTKTIGLVFALILQQ